MTREAAKDRLKAKLSDKAATPPKPSADSAGAEGDVIKAGLTYRPYPVECLPNPLKDLVIHGTASIGTDEANIAVQGWGHAAGMVNKARRGADRQRLEGLLRLLGALMRLLGRGQIAAAGSYPTTPPGICTRSSTQGTATATWSSPMPTVLPSNRYCARTPEACCRVAMRHPHSWVV